MNRISFLNRGYAFKGLLAVFQEFESAIYHHRCLAILVKHAVQNLKSV